MPLCYYSGGDKRIPPELVVRAVEFCERKMIQLLLGCDVNAHHENWESSDINRRDAFLLEFIPSNKLQTYNVGNAPTTVTTQARGTRHNSVVRVL